MPPATSPTQAAAERRVACLKAKFDASRLRNGAASIVIMTMTAMLRMRMTMVVVSVSVRAIVVMIVVAMIMRVSVMLVAGLVMVDALRRTADARILAEQQ